MIHVLANEDFYIGSQAFGLTNCNPESIDVQNLSEDSDLLLDRSEYRVVSKDVANCPAIGDELSFTVKQNGSVEFSKINVCDVCGYAFGKKEYLLDHMRKHTGKLLKLLYEKSILIIFRFEL